MKKLWLCLSLLAFLCLSLTGCVGEMMFFGMIANNDDRADKEEIFRFVLEHEDVLVRAIETGHVSAFENYECVQNINENERAVDFSCGGAGIGSSTSYVGFYYLPEEDIAAVWGSRVKEGLVPSGSGFEWRAGDDRYCLERICGCFFFYEQSY